MRLLSREALTPLRNKIISLYGSGSIKVDRLKALNSAEIKIQGMFADELDRRPVMKRLALLSETEINTINALFIEKLKAAASAQDVLYAIDERMNAIATIANEKKADVLEGCETLFASFEKLAEEKALEDKKAAQNSLAETEVLSAIDSALKIRTKELVEQEKQEKIIESRQAAQQLLVDDIVLPVITGALKLRSKEIEAQLRQEKIIEKEERKKAAIIEQALREKQTRVKHFAAFQARSVMYIAKIKAACALHEEALINLIARMQHYYRIEKPGSRAGIDLISERMQLKMLIVRAKHISESVTEASPHAAFLAYSFYTVLQKVKVNLQASRPAGSLYLPLEGLETPISFLTIEKILNAFSIKEALTLPLSAAVNDFFEVLGKIYNVEVGYINTILVGNLREIEGIALHFWVLRQQAAALATAMFDSLSKGEMIQRSAFLNQLFSDINNQFAVICKILKENKDNGIAHTLSELLADFQAKTKALDCFEKAATATVPVSQVRAGLFSVPSVREPWLLSQKAEAMVAHINRLFQSAESTTVALAIFALQDYELRYKTIAGLEKTVQNPSFTSILRTYITLFYQAVYVTPEREILMHVILQRAIHQLEIELVHERCFPRIGDHGLILHNKVSNQTIDLGPLRDFFEQLITPDVRVTIEDLVQAKQVSEKQARLLEAGTALYLLFTVYDIEIKTNIASAECYCETEKTNFYADLLTVLNSLLMQAFSGESLTHEVFREQCNAVCDRLQELTTLITKHEPGIVQTLLWTTNIAAFRNSLMLALNEVEQLSQQAVLRQ